MPNFLQFFMGVIKYGHYYKVFNIELVHLCQDKNITNTDIFKYYFALKKILD